jgi:hypothetical protein
LTLRETLSFGTSTLPLLHMLVASGAHESL